MLLVIKSSDHFTGVLQLPPLFSISQNPAKDQALANLPSVVALTFMGSQPKLAEIFDSVSWKDHRSTLLLWLLELEVRKEKKIAVFIIVIRRTFVCYNGSSSPSLAYYFVLATQWSIIINLIRTIARFLMKKMFSLSNKDQSFHEFWAFLIGR